MQIVSLSLHLGHSRVWQLIECTEVFYLLSEWDQTEGVCVASILVALGLVRHDPLSLLIKHVHLGHAFSKVTIPNCGQSTDAIFLLL